MWIPTAQNDSGHITAPDGQTANMAVSLPLLAGTSAAVGAAATAAAIGATAGVVLAVYVGAGIAGVALGAARAVQLANAAHSGRMVSAPAR